MPSRRVSIAVFALLLCAGCGDRTTEYRLRAERGRDKPNFIDDLAENNGYSKYRDRLWRKHHIEQQQRNQEEASRVNRAKKGIKDGSLMEKYALGPGEKLPPDE